MELEAQQVFSTGVNSLHLGELEKAEACFRAVIALEDAFAEPYANLGIVLEQKGLLNEALHLYQSAAERQPNNSQILNLWGICLMRLKYLPEAEAIFRKALRLVPEAVQAWINLGVLLASVKREEEAQQCFLHALARESGAQKAHFNLAYLFLRRGQYLEGWRYFEARPSGMDLGQLLSIHRWDGQTTLLGKHLLIGVDGGHGDMIQFCRYVLEIRSRGCSRISLVCQPGLKRLFSNSLAVDLVFSIEDELPIEHWDFWVPMLSLPGIFQTKVDSIPAPLPYLSASLPEAGVWQHRLSHSPEILRIGLVWQGNQQYENDAERSVPVVSELVSALCGDGIRLYSLQKHGVSTSNFHQELPAGLVDLSPEIHDFADTAAIIENLDLVISVDTAVAHLAGALAKPCWILLPYFRTDWRWLDDERTDSPWYPKVVRLFRQKRLGDWSGIFGELKRALQEHWRQPVSQAKGAI